MGRTAQGHFWTMSQRKVFFSLEDFPSKLYLGALCAVLFIILAEFRNYLQTGHRFPDQFEEH